MKIVNKQLKDTADINASKDSALSELFKLTFMAGVLLIAAYFFIGIAVDIGIRTISFKTEAKIFNSLEISKNFKKTDTSAYKKKIDLIKNILKKFKNRPYVPELPYSIFVIDNKEPNAFAIPGGSIGVTTGLMDILNEDIEIAFVMGHEIGHFKNRDHLKGLGRSIGFSIITSAIFGSGFDSGSIDSIINVGFQRHYSRQREVKADQFGIELVYDVYGKTKGTEKLFKVLKEKKHIPEWAYMLSTHPSPDERIKKLEEFSKRIE